MSENELRDLNRRVAVALGWRHVMSGYIDKWRGTIRGWTVESVDTGISPKAGGNAGMPEEIPNYCTDPIAADLVRQEIERRKWTLATRSQIPGYEDDPQPRYWIVEIVKPWSSEKGAYVKSTTSHHHAICLAFLAVCEDKERKEAGK